MRTESKLKAETLRGQLGVSGHAGCRLAGWNMHCLACLFFVVPQPTADTRWELASAVFRKPKSQLYISGPAGCDAEPAAGWTHQCPQAQRGLRQDWTELSQQGDSAAHRFLAAAWFMFLRWVMWQWAASEWGQVWAIYRRKQYRYICFDIYSRLWEWRKWDEKSILIKWIAVKANIKHITVNPDNTPDWHRLWAGETGRENIWTTWGCALNQQKCTISFLDKCYDSRRQLIVPKIWPVMSWFGRGPEDSAEQTF